MPAPPHIDISRLLTPQFLTKMTTVGIEVFAGAGGMSLGASRAGIRLIAAIEKDPRAAATFCHNNPGVEILLRDVRGVRARDLPRRRRADHLVLFGGAPCQGFSYSNQRTRSAENESNWLLLDFVRLCGELKPDSVVFENVRGFADTAGGIFLEELVNRLGDLGYFSLYHILDAADFGVPQHRARFFLIAARAGDKLEFPRAGTVEAPNVRDAIADLPHLRNGAAISRRSYRRRASSKYAQEMRGGLEFCENHLVTQNAEQIIARYKHIPQGGNWASIPGKLMKSYADRTRCHTGIYRRLEFDRPSLVLGNFRKNMLIHPSQDRGLSVREAARLQSFPDSYEFLGTVGLQQQHVGNAVPPKLAEAVFRSITSK